MADKKLESTTYMPTSLRLSQDSKDRFAEIGKQLGSNQEETMKSLLEAYEIAKTRSNIKGHESELARFEGFTTALTHLYISMIEENITMRDTVEADFAELLTSKDDTIRDLQKRTQKAESAAEEISKTDNEKNEKIVILEEKTTTLSQELSNLQEELAEWKSRYDSAYQRCASLEEQLNRKTGEAKNMSAQIGKVAGEKDRLLETIRQMQTEHKDSELLLRETLQDNKLLKEKLDFTENEYESRFEEKLEVEIKRARLEIEKEYLSRLDKEVTALRKERDEIAQKYMSLLEKKESETKAMSLS